MHHENDILKLRLRATINRVRFVFWRIKMSAGAIIHCRFVKKKYHT
jgi:cell division protein FtsB